MKALNAWMVSPPFIMYALGISEIILVSNADAHCVCVCLLCWVVTLWVNLVFQKLEDPDQDES